MRSKTHLLALNGVIAAAYAALTLVASAMNLAYGPVQFRFSEALTVLHLPLPRHLAGGFCGLPGGQSAQPLRPHRHRGGLPGHPPWPPCSPRRPTAPGWRPCPRWCATWSWWGACWPGTRWASPPSSPPSSASTPCGWASARPPCATLLGMLLIKGIPKVSYLRRYIPESRRGLRHTA